MDESRLSMGFEATFLAQYRGKIKQRYKILVKIRLIEISPSNLRVFKLSLNRHSVVSPADAKVTSKQTIEGFPDLDTTSFWIFQPLCSKVFLIICIFLAPIVGATPDRGATHDCGSVMWHHKCITIKTTISNANHFWCPFSFQKMFYKASGVLIICVMRSLKITWNLFSKGKWFSNCQNLVNAQHWKFS